MTSSVWDDPDLAPPPETAFVKLDKIGDGFSGTVIEVTKVRFEDDGSYAPQLDFLDDYDGTRRSYTVGQTDAKRKFAELRPGNGDHVTVKFVGTSGKFKHVDVQVTPQKQAAAAVQQQPAPAVNLPTYQQPAPVGQSYQAVAPPVYATNGGNGVTAPSVPAPPTAPTIGPPPAGIDPVLWARMAPEQRALFPTAVEPAF